MTDYTREMTRREFIRLALPTQSMRERTRRHDSNLIDPLQNKEVLIPRDQVIRSERNGGTQDFQVIRIPAYRRINRYRLCHGGFGFDKRDDLIGNRPGKSYLLDQSPPQLSEQFPADPNFMLVQTQLD